MANQAIYVICISSNPWTLPVPGLQGFLATVKGY